MQNGRVKSVKSIVFSPCGGTGKVLEAMTKDIPLPLEEYDVTLPAERVTARIFAKDNLVFLGFPVYSGRVPRNAADVFGGLSGQDTPAVLVAVYGNRDYDGALLDLHKLASERGFRPVAAAAAIAEHSMTSAIATGRPDVADTAALARFGLDVLSRLQRDDSVIEAPGTYPAPSATPPGAFAIQADEKCTDCGTCFQHCPSQAIAEDDLRHTDSARCIVCMACIKYCPEKARAFVNEAIGKMVSERLKETASDRKEPAFFL